MWKVVTNTSLWNEVVASSSVLSKPNCQRLMKQSGSLVRSYLGTHTATLSPLELPKGRRQKSYVPTSLLGQSTLEACLQGGGTYVLLLPPGAELTQLTGCLEAPQGLTSCIETPTSTPFRPRPPQARPHQPFRLRQYTARPRPSHSLFVSGSLLGLTQTSKMVRTRDHSRADAHS